MDQEFVSALRTAFASEYAFLIKTQDAHWNVQGDDFYQLHLLFERIYTEVQEAIDPFAENLRKCQIFVPSGLARMTDLSIVDGWTEDENDCEAFLQGLLDDSDALADLFAHVFDIAEAKHEHGLSNFMADRQDAHRTHSWMLRMQLVPEPNEPADA
jgi:starvation-inducible DNA-binding protein